MKKLIALLLVLTMAVSMAACAPANEETKPSQDATNPSQDATEPSQDAPAPTEPSQDATEPSQDATDPTEPSQPSVETNEAVDMLASAWDKWESEYKEYFAGGTTKFDDDYNVLNPQGAPGVVDAEELEFGYYVPNANLSSVSAAASVYHSLNKNNFTAATFIVEDAAAFAAIMKDALLTTNYVCGFPEHLLVYTLSDNCVLYVLGNLSVMEGFGDAVMSAYPNATVIYDGAVEV